MKELTEKQAIDYSIELWEWLTKTGKEKNDWEGWGKHEEAECDCFLCKYDLQRGSDRVYCENCPYYQKFGLCDDYDTPYDKWVMAETPRTRKKYANLFLEQLYQLREGK